VTPKNSQTRMFWKNKSRFATFGGSQKQQIFKIFLPHPP